jgi:hypothetical protein
MIASILAFENVRETVPLRLRLGTKLSSKARAGEDNRKASMKARSASAKVKGKGSRSKRCNLSEERTIAREVKALRRQHA